MVSYYVSFRKDRAYSKDMGQPDDALELEDKRTFLDELDSEYFSSRVSVKALLFPVCLKKLSDS